jgi:hypothetical protein
MLNQWQQLVNQKLTASPLNYPPRHYDLTQFGLISIEGEDSRRFLQGQITADIEQITPNNAKLSAVCNPQGRISSLFLLIARSQQQFLCLMPHELIETTLKTLSKFAVFYKTSLQDVTHEWAVYGVDDDQSEPFAVTHHAPSPTTDAQTEPTNNSMTIGWFGNRSICVCPIDVAIQHWNDLPNTVSDYQHWLAADIQAGIPRLYRNTIETFLPHNLNLPELSAVSFNKGCYTGQEVIARMHYKGKLKSHMRYLVGEISEQHQEPPAPGDEIIADNNKMGEVICAAQIGAQWHVLAFCKDIIESATKIQCNVENAPILSLRN